MANNYSEIVALTTGKNSMGLSNTIKRDFGIPLDYSSVQESYEAALNYAKTSTLAYIGQPISVGDTLYVVTDEANGYLKAVGTKPTGDNKSISVDDNGVVSIYGFAAAEGATLPRKNTDGTIEWVAIDAIVSGDGNEKTRIVAADGSDITVTPKYDATNDTYTYTLDVQFPAIPEYTVTKEVGTGKTTYKVTKDGVQVGEAIEVPDAYNDKAVTDDIAEIKADITDHEGRISTVEERVETFFGAVETIKETADAIDVLNGTGDGSVAKAINDAISTQAATDTAKYATKDALAQNTSDIFSLTAQLNGIDEATQTLSGHVGILETKTTTLEGDLQAETSAREALAGTVNQHTTDITGLKAKDDELAAAISENTNKFADYAKTSEVSSLIASEIGKIDHKALEDGIAANGTAIADEVTRAKVKETELAASIKTNEDAISENAGEIARIDRVLKAAIENEDDTALNSIKELADWVSKHDTEVLPVVNANTAAIEKLNGTGDGSVAKAVADAVTQIPVATMQNVGLVKASSEVTVAQDGTMEIGYISTDKLIAGNETWVLHGGNAGVVTQ